MRRLGTASRGRQRGVKSCGDAETDRAPIRPRADRKNSIVMLFSAAPLEPCAKQVSRPVLDRRRSDPSCQRRVEIVVSQGIRIDRSARVPVLPRAGAGGGLDRLAGALGRRASRSEPGVTERGRRPAPRAE